MTCLQLEWVSSTVTIPVKEGISSIFCELDSKGAPEYVANNYINLQRNHTNSLAPIAFP